jgi:hypothetical protein
MVMTGWATRGRIARFSCDIETEKGELSIHVKSSLSLERVKRTQLRDYAINFQNFSNYTVVKIGLRQYVELVLLTGMDPNEFGSIAMYVFSFPFQTM